MTEVTIENLIAQAREAIRRITRPDYIMIRLLDIIENQQEQIDILASQVAELKKEKETE